MGFSRTKARTVPELGVISGPSMKDWRFYLLRVQVVDGAIEILARITPPNWPFPFEGPLTDVHFTKIRAVVGERAKRFDVNTLIGNAYAAARLPVPEWALDEKTSLRARMKRSRIRRTT